MADSPKVLAQSNPASGTLTTLYTVPANRYAVCISIIVCNQSSSTIHFRVSVAVAAAADTPAQYLYFDVVLTKNDTFIATIGVTLATTDVVRVQADSSQVSFNLFGVEVM